MKKFIKNLLCLLLAAAMIFTLAACADEDDSSSDEKDNSKAKDEVVEEVKDDEPEEEEKEVNEEVIDIIEDKQTANPVKVVDKVEQAPAPKNSDIQKFVDEYGTEFAEGLKTGFESSSGGITCNCSVEAVGNAIHFKIKMNGINDIPAESKAQMQALYDSQQSTFATQLADFKTELPSLTNVTIFVCEEDGDVLATIKVNF